METLILITMVTVLSTTAVVTVVMVAGFAALDVEALPAHQQMKRYDNLNKRKVG